MAGHGGLIHRFARRVLRVAHEAPADRQSRIGSAREGTLSATGAGHPWPGHGGLRLASVALQTTTGGGVAMDLDEKVVIVSCDTHIGPRVKEDLREYCPKKYLEEFDTFVKWCEEQAGIGGTDALRLTTGHHDVHTRLRDLDQDGVACEVIFHGSQNGQPIPW